MVRSLLAVIWLIVRMLHNNTAVATDLYLCSGGRTVHIDAILTADTNFFRRMIFPWAIAAAGAPQGHRRSHDQQKNTYRYLANRKHFRAFPIAAKVAVDRLPN
jgi:hypothetical protein